MAVGAQAELEYVAMLERMGQHKADSGMMLKEALGMTLWEHALSGDLQAAKLLLEYLVGKPLQRVKRSADFSHFAAFGPADQARAAAAVAEWEKTMGEDGGTG
jgi:hypothetical protein